MMPVCQLTPEAAVGGVLERGGLHRGLVSPQRGLVSWHGPDWTWEDLEIEARFPRNVRGWGRLLPCTSLLLSPPRSS